MAITDYDKAVMFDIYKTMLPSRTSENKASTLFKQFMSANEEKISFYENWLTSPGKSYAGSAGVPPSELLEGYLTFLKMHSSHEGVTLPEYVPTGVARAGPSYFTPETMVSSSEVVSDDLAQELFGKWKDQYALSNKQSLTNKLARNFADVADIAEEDAFRLNDTQLDMTEFMSPVDLSSVRNVFKRYQINQKQLGKMMSEVLKALFATKNVDTLKQFATKANIEGKGDELAKALQNVTDLLGIQDIKKLQQMMPDIKITKEEMADLFKGRLPSLLSGLYDKDVLPKDELEIIGRLEAKYMGEWLPTYQSIPKGSGRYMSFLNWVVKNYPKNVAEIGGPQRLREIVNKHIKAENEKIKNKVRSCIETATTEITAFMYKGWLLGETVTLAGTGEAGTGLEKKVEGNARSAEFIKRFENLATQTVKTYKIDPNMFVAPKTVDQLQQYEVEIVAGQDTKLSDTERKEMLEEQKASKSFLPKPTTALGVRNLRALNKLYNEYLPAFMKEVINQQEKAIKVCIKGVAGEDKKIRFIKGPDDLYAWSAKARDMGLAGKLWKDDYARFGLDYGRYQRPAFQSIYAPRAQARRGPLRALAGRWQPEEEPFLVDSFKQNGGGCGYSSEESLNFDSSSSEYNWF